MPLQIRRGTNAERQALIPSNGLVVGELLYVTDSQRLYIGTGASGEHQGLSVTGYTSEDAVDAAGAALVAGVHSGITFTYGNTQDAAGRIDAAIDLSGYTGEISAAAFKGSVFGDDSTPIVDAINNTLNGNLTGNVTGNLTGNSSGIHTGAVTGNITGNVIGNVIGSLTGFHTGDVRGSIFADDSSLMVDGISGTIIAPVNAVSITGDVFGRYVEISGSSTTNPGQKAGLKIITDGNADDSYDLFTLSGSKTDENGMSVIYERSRGTPTNPLPLEDGDEILGQYWFGADTASVQQIAAAIVVVVDGSPAAGKVPGSLEIATANISTGLPTAGLTIDSSQVIGVASNTLVAGGASGEVNTGSVATYLKIRIGATEYAIPAYAIRP